ncbi:MAG: MurR/RpiR family transcriptional regulator [Clostridia bacterium]
MSNQHATQTMTSLVSRIATTEHTLKGGARKIYEFISAHPELVINSSIDVLAKRIGVSESSVVRFCRQLGYEGFRHLKVVLAQETAVSDKYIYEELTPGESMYEIRMKVCRAALATIESTLRGLSDSSLEAAAEAIIAARRILVLGAGASSISALDAAHKLMTLGLPCVHYGDNHLQAVAASHLGREDVVIAFSHSGRTKDVMDSLQLARRCGARIVGVTNSPSSPMGRLCDIVLPTSARETLFRSDDRLAQLSVIDVLYVTVLLKNYNKLSRGLKSSELAVADKKVHPKRDFAETSEDAEAK